MIEVELDEYYGVGVVYRAPTEVTYSNQTNGMLCNRK